MSNEPTRRPNSECYGYVEIYRHLNGKLSYTGKDINENEKALTLPLDTLTPNFNCTTIAILKVFLK